MKYYDKRRAIVFQIIVMQTNDSESLEIVTDTIAIYGLSI